MTYVHLKQLNAAREAGSTPGGGPASEKDLAASAALPPSSSFEKVTRLLEVLWDHPGDHRVTALIGALLNERHSTAEILEAAQHHRAIAHGKPSTEVAERAYRSVLKAIRCEKGTVAGGSLQESNSDVQKKSSPLEGALRAQGRIQDNKEILASLGFKGEIPEIPEHLMEEALKVGGHLVLDTKVSLANFKTAFNEVATRLGIAGRITTSFGAEKADSFTQRQFGSPRWLLVPDTVKTGVIGKAVALEQSEEPCYLPSPREIVLMLGYSHLEAGLDSAKRMQGFQGKRTFTSERNTVVGYVGQNIEIVQLPLVDKWGMGSIGLAQFGPNR